MASNDTVTMTREHFNKMLKSARDKGLAVDDIEAKAKHHTYGASKLPLVTVDHDVYQDAKQRSR